MDLKMLSVVQLMKFLLDMLHRRTRRYNIMLMQVTRHGLQTGII